jgi:hypothetical protein
MPFSTITDGTNTFEFVGDEEYQVDIGLFEHIEGAYPDGQGFLGSSGASITHIKCSGQAISDKNTQVTSSDEQIWERLIPIIKDNTDPANAQTLTLVLTTGNLILTGWCIGASVTRGAPEGVVAANVTIDFLVKTINSSGLS